MGVVGGQVALSLFQQARQVALGDVGQPLRHPLAMHWTQGFVYRLGYGPMQGFIHEKGVVFGQFGQGADWPGPGPPTISVLGPQRGMGAQLGQGAIGGDDQAVAIVHPKDARPRMGMGGAVGEGGILGELRPAEFLQNGEIR